MNPNVINTFIVPDGATLVAALNTNPSRRTTRDGDCFAMTVRSPSQYSGAIVEGYVANLNRSGRINGR